MGGPIPGCDTFRVIWRSFLPYMPVNQHAKQRKKRTEPSKNVVTQRLRRVAIIAVPPLRMLDVFGPAEVFTDANRLRGGEPAYEVEIISVVENQGRSHQSPPLVRIGWPDPVLTLPIDSNVVSQNKVRFLADASFYAASKSASFDAGPYSMRRKTARAFLLIAITALATAWTAVTPFSNLCFAALSFA